MAISDHARRLPTLLAVAALLLVTPALAPASASTSDRPPADAATWRPAVTEGPSVRVESIYRPSSTGSPRTAAQSSDTHTVSLRTVGRDGKPASLRWTALPRTDGDYALGGVFPDGTGTVDLPPGDYAIEAIIGLSTGGDAAEEEISLLVQPMFTVDGDIEWVADARDAGSVTMGLDGDVPTTAETFEAIIGYQLVTDRFFVGAFLSAESFDTLHIGRLGPEAPGDETLSTVAGAWGEPGTDGDFRRTPYIYAGVDHRPGEIITGYDSTVSTDSMAEIASTIHGDASEPPVTLDLDYHVPGSYGSGSLTWKTVPSARTRLHLSVDEIEWAQSVVTEFDEQTGPGIVHFDPVARQYQPGRHYTQRWRAAVLGPRLPAGTTSAERFGDMLAAGLQMFSDADGHWGSDRAARGDTRLYRDGRLVAESPVPGHLVAPGQPDDPATYRLEVTAKGGPDARWSTEQSAIWEFVSAAPDTPSSILPLWTASFEPKVDTDNIARAHPVTLLPFRLEAADEAEVGTMRRPRVSVSFDRGATWRSAPVMPAFGDPNRWRAVVLTPPGADGGTVSLRMKAVDSDGNRVEQTIIDAYGLA